MNTLPDGYLKMGAVSLSVRDLSQSVNYYQEQIGLELLQDNKSQAVLGIGEKPLVKLHHFPGATRRRGVTGLYHFALLVPTRLDLAKSLSHFVQVQTPITGAADHLVSEAVYLSDPDGHGIEIYRDRPREDWYNEEGIMIGDTIPLDIDGVIGELNGSQPDFTGLSGDTVMGHIHLHVSHLSAAENFYLGIIGLNKPPSALNQIPSASFVSAGGYHHHLGLNTWAGEGAPPPAEGDAQMLNYEILFPDQDSLETVLQRLRAAFIETTQKEEGWLIQDPSQNRILIKLA